MLRFALSQLRHRPARTGALAAGILVATLGFVLLVAAGKTSELRVSGSVKSNFRTSYDILVRPAGALSQLERRDQLVRDNYLSGAYGGITLRQYAATKRIPGVAVAAPIANVGYILPYSSAAMRVSLLHLFTRAPYQLYRVRFAWLGHDGGSHYPAGTSYVYFTRRDAFASGNTTSSGFLEFIPGRQRPIDTVTPFLHGVYGGKVIRPTSPRAVGPFAPAHQSDLLLFSALTPGEGRGKTYGAVTTAVYFPMLVAAIDPQEEAKLLHLDRTIFAGRYLREGERPTIARAHPWRQIPVIASTRSYLGESLAAEVERLEAPATEQIPLTLASPRAYRFLTRLTGRMVERRVFSAAPIYGPMLRDPRGVSFMQYWTISGVRYRVQHGLLVPLETRNPISVWRSMFFGLGGGYFPAPTENEDVQFRRLHARVASNLFGKHHILNAPNIKVVGRYDPTRLPSFSPLSRVPLETYYPPLLEPADAGSTKALHGRPLLPTQNVGDYIAQPPLLLTTLSGMRPFLNSTYFQGASAKAPISVIRVRVAGVTGPHDQARVHAVAAAIHQRTGLAVDITAGSSPHPLLVALSRGKFGRPPLLLREGWSKKGVAVSFLSALDRKRLALFSLVLVVSLLFLANGVFASVRARRAELGTLLCLGWRRRQLVACVLGEVGALGLLAGALGSGIAFLVGAVSSLTVPTLEALLVVPLASLLAVLSGVLPAWEVGRGVPLDAVRPPAARATAPLRARTLFRLALVNLMRFPLRAALAAMGLLVGVAALALLLGIERAFRGTLVGTLLGQAIALQIHGFDFVAAALVIALAALSLADLLFLSLRERAAEIVTLRTSGWRERDLGRVLAYEAAWVGIVGGLAGALAALAGGQALGMPLTPLLVAAAIAALVGVGVALLSSLLPLLYLARLRAPGVLAAEA